MSKPEANPHALRTLVGLLDGVFASCANSVEEMVYSPSNKTHVACMVHYLHATKNARACMSLVKSCDFCAIPIVLRAVVESAASLKNLSVSEGYVELLWDDAMLRYRDDVKHFSKLVSNAVGSKSRGCALNIVKEIESIDAEREGAPRKRISQQVKFSDAGMTDHYVLLYSTFSGVTHGNLLSLFQEHTIIENNTIIVVDQDIKSKEHLYHLCDILLTSTFIAVESAYSILGLNAEEILAKLKNSLDEFRELFVQGRT